MDSGSPAFRWLFGRCVFDEAQLELRLDGHRVELERKPLEVLRHLLRHAGEVVTKDELQNAVWAGRVLSDTVLTKAVSRIREVLADDGQTVIKTVHGYGYRLVAPVQVEAATAALQPVLGLSIGDTPPSRPQWQLQSHIGSGASGEVWQVGHAKTGDLRVFKFALKPEALDGLKREITLFRLLRQQLGETAPVVEILDWNLEEAPYFTEMRHYPDGSLLDWATAHGGLGAVPLAERLALFARLADALAAVHGVGVLHKDLKPANVLVARSSHGTDHPVLADFGVGGVLAEELIAQAGITRLGFTRKTDSDPQGTPLYLAPEVLEGQPQTLKSDLYALGVMLYQLCVGDWRKPIAPGWEQAVDDALLRQDIAAAVHGNPAYRIDSAAELADRVRRLPERHLALQQTAAQATLAAEAETRLKAAQLRMDRLRVRRKWMLATMAVFLTGAVTAAGFAWQARQANARTQAAMQFLLDDVFGGFSLKQGPAKQLTINSLVERAARRVDERFAPTDLASRAQAYSALWSLYGISDYSTLDFTFSDWLEREMLRSVAAWFADDPQQAYRHAYRIVIETDFWNNNPEASALADAVAHYAAAHPELPEGQRLHLQVRQAEEHIKRGRWLMAVDEMQALESRLQAQAGALVRDEPFTLFTAVNNANRLSLSTLGRALCTQMEAPFSAPGTQADTALRLEYLTACAVSAGTRGDAAAALTLSQQGLALARANYDDMVGYVPTFLRFQGLAQLEMGQAQPAFTNLEEAAALRRRMDDGLLPYALTSLGAARERLGQPQAALNDYRDASAALEHSEFPLLAVESHSRYARALAEAGQIAAADAALARLPAAARAQLPPAHRATAWLLQAQAALAIARGQKDVARQQLDEADRILQVIGYAPDRGWRQDVARQRQTAAP